MSTAYVAHTSVQIYTASESVIVSGIKITPSHKKLRDAMFRVGGVQGGQYEAALLWHNESAVWMFDHTACCGRDTWVNFSCISADGTECPCSAC